MGVDFNDIALGILENPVKPGDNWPEPEPITKEDGPRPYPIDAIPDGIRQAVQEVLAFSQSPPALAACSALSALSLAGQGLADVRRAEGLTGPVSLFFLTLNDSGERKSSVDGLFTESIRERELRQAEAAKPELARYRADHAAWEAERSGLLAKIKSKPNQMLRDQLREHEQSMPEAPRYPQMIHQDSTPEALAWSLANRWPSGGVMSNEAACIFGGHGMGRDSVMRNLALLNIIWDGASLRIDRRTAGCFTVQGARLTMGLATQPATIREFFEASKGLARGSGFLARFLICHPETTQGTRFWKDAPASWPCLTKFQNRLIELLEQTPNPDGDRGLEPPMMDFSTDGRAAWIGIYNMIEADLAPDGDLETLRDFASKAADNIARLAALFAIYDAQTDIGAENVQRSFKIVLWHLHESRRFFGEIHTNPQDLLAGKLDKWLLDRGEPTVHKSIILTNGPNALRKKESLDSALIALEKLNRIRVSTDGNKTTVEINPALLKGPK